VNAIVFSADQSEYIVLLGRRGFNETGTKQRLTERLAREVPQQCQICENVSRL